MAELSNLLLLSPYVAYFLLYTLIKRTLHGFGKTRSLAVSGFLTVGISLALANLVLKGTLITGAIVSSGWLLCIIGIILVFVPIASPQVYLGPFGHIIRYTDKIGLISGALIPGLIFLLSGGF